MDEYYVIINALREVINNDESFKFDSSMDWERIFYLAQQHKVENIVAYALLPYEHELEESIRNLYMSAIYISTVVDTQQDYELAELLKLFCKNKVKYMILKGYKIKQLYPAQNMRSMGDIDILIHPEDADKVKTIAASVGYCITYENIREFNCQKAPNINIEIHLDLISVKYKRLHTYYIGCWERAVKEDECSYCMTAEDYFIYHVVHLMKHYKGTGTGIRSFLDIYVYLKNNKEMLNWRYIDNELKMLDLDVFAKNCMELAEAWFGCKEKNALLKEMEKYVFKSGVYGSDEHAEIYEKVLMENRWAGFVYLRILFPSIHDMSAKYHILRRHPYLLPIYWVKRLIWKILKKHKKKHPLIELAKKDDKAIAISRHFKEVGL